MTDVWDCLYDAFASLNDPRVERTKHHSLIDIISIAICAVICGADSWVALETFGKAKQPWLQRYLALPNGIPSHDTFGRFFAALDATAFQQHFSGWVRAIWPAEAGEVITVDGKTLRRSHDRGIGKEAIHLVSVWAQHSRLVVAQRAVESKSNEITAIPAVLQLLDLKGCTVTIDAMGCQTAIARQIVRQGGEYMLAVKDNQEQLHTDSADTFRYVADDDWEGVAHAHRRTVEAGHGRIETRDYWLITEPDYLGFLNPHDAWRDVGGIGMVMRQRSIAGVTSQEIGYYLLSGSPTIERFASAVRGHWGIENQVHWVLDVTFNEDASRIRTGDGAQNFAVLRHIALNLLRHEASAGSIANKRFRAALDDAYLLRVLQT
jgi:predicted transposase YbfD/YdcC